MYFMSFTLHFGFREPIAIRTNFEDTESCMILLDCDLFLDMYSAY